MASKVRKRYQRIQKNTKGTNDFLILAVILGALCIWAIRDGWFPTKSKLEEHPVRVEIEFIEGGRVVELLMQEGESYGANAPLIRLDTTQLQEELDAAKAELGRIQSELGVARPTGEGADADRIAEIRVQRNQAAQQVSSIRQSILRRELRAPDKAGRLIEYLVDQGEFVEAGQAGVAVKPDTYFYVFNKSLAYLSFIGAIVSLIIHLRIK